MALIALTTEDTLATWRTRINSIIADQNTRSNTVIADADLDTKVQAEESTDEDIIRVDIAGTEVANISATNYVFNDAGGDMNYRIESNNNQYMFYIDGGKDSIVLGNDTDVSSVDQLVRIGRKARNATAGTNYYDLIISPVATVTIPSGTTALVAGLAIYEPNITATGTVTEASTVYISSAPTEGGSNYALHVASGAVSFGSTLLVTGLATVSGGATIAGAVDVNATTLAIDGSSSMAIGTASSGVALSLGHTTSETTVNDNLTVTGLATVSTGATIAGPVDVNATTLAIDGSSSMTIGTASSGVALSLGHTTSETTVNDNLTVTGTSGLSITNIGGLLTPSAGMTLSGAVDINATTLAIDGSSSMSIGTASSSIALSLGHTTSETTVNDNLTVTGTATVNGTTVTMTTPTVALGTFTTSNTSLVTNLDADKWDGGNKTVSTSAPSGGAAGDVWFRYVA